MKVALSLPRRTSYADYLAVESASEHRHEFLDGVIVAMAGGSHEHNAIASRFAYLFGARLPRGCRSYTPDQRFWIAATRRARYSDAAVICGAPDEPPHDPQAATNPLLIVEVLSPSSEGDDDGDKRHDFETLASLEAYVLAAQDARVVRVYRRVPPGGAWRDMPDVYKDGDRFDLPALQEPILVAEIYDDILAPGGRSLLK